MNVDFKLIKSPIILKRSEEYEYSFPVGFFKNDSFCLFALKKGKTSSITEYVTSDFMRWSEEKTIAEDIDSCSIKNIYAAEEKLYISYSDGSSFCYDSVTGESCNKKCNNQNSELSVSVKDGNIALFDKAGTFLNEIDTEKDYIAKDGVISEPSLAFDNASGFTYLLYVLNGSIALAVSKDGVNYINFTRDNPTLPDNGIIYEGDYYDAIPVSEYIHKEAIPVGDNVVDIRDYGAVADKYFISTSAFRAASAELERRGGGILLVAGGYYCTSEVSIPDNTTLFIDIDSAVYCSKDHTRVKDGFVKCIGVKNVRITGGGKIIGNGEYYTYLPYKTPRLKPLEYIQLPPVFYDPMGYPVGTIRNEYRFRIRYAEDRYGEDKPLLERPMYTVWVRESKNVSIENIIIKDAFSWTLTIDCSENVYVKDIIIDDNRHVANSDGIDVMGSQHVFIDHAFVSCADDGLCVKSPGFQGHDGLNLENPDVEMGPTYDVHFKNCTVLTVMNSFKIGTETYYDISNVSIEDCHFMMPDIYPGSVSGISILSSDGAAISDVTVKNITMDNICCPLFICLNMRNKFGFKSEEDRVIKQYGGSIKDIKISNISAVNAEVPSIITGFLNKEIQNPVERRVENIEISDFKVKYAEDEERLTILPEIHESLYDYPENNSLGDVPAYGLYIRHADNVSLKDICIDPRSSNTRKCIVEDSATVEYC